MDTVQFSPKRQSKQETFVFVLPSMICFFLQKIVGVCKDPLLRVYVPSAQGMHRQAPSFLICFTLPFVQPIDNAEML